MGEKTLPEGELLWQAPKTKNVLVEKRKVSRWSSDYIVGLKKQLLIRRTVFRWIRSKRTRGDEVPLQTWLHCSIAGQNWDLCNRRWPGVMKRMMLNRKLSVYTTWEASWDVKHDRHNGGPVVRPRRGSLWNPIRSIQKANFEKTTGDSKWSN